MSPGRLVLMPPSRLMRLLTRDGVIDAWIEVGSDDASTIGSCWNAIQQFLGTGEVEGLAPFRDTVVGGHLLETDPDWIEYWAYHGDLGFPDIYSLR
jgi:hypothetical protein